MALAFNVNAGPLAQIGLEIIDLPTAMYLVKRLWNWKQQSESLTHVLSASGAHLVSTSSFNLLEYRRIRKKESRGLLGIFVQGGSIVSTRLPKASTALPDDPGQACLRALATAILCLYGSETAIAILQDLIPYALLQQDQDDVNLVFEGPLLASLTDWVRSVAAEEECDDIRDALLKEVTRRESELTGLPVEDLLNMDLGQPSELPFVVGVLKWSLIPTARRASSTYATRSLRAWSMAAILHSLGFAVYPAAYIAHEPTPRETSESFGDNLVEGEVFINTRAGADTDAMITSNAIFDEVRAPLPTLTHMGGIPRLAFRHLSGAPHHISTTGLTDIWQTAFCAGRKGLQNFTLRNDGSPSPHLYFDWHDSSKENLPDLHQRLLDLFKRHRIPTGFDNVLRPIMLANVPVSEEESWNPSLIVECLRTGTCRNCRPELRKSLLRNAYVLKAIVLGGLYGLCSNAIVSRRPHGDDDDLEEVLSLEIAFSAEIALPCNFDDLVSWVARLQGACNPVPDFQSMPPDPFSWFDLLAWMFLGEKSRPVNPMGTTSYTLCRRHAGLLLISDFLVRPTIALEASFRYQLLRGQLLNLPFTASGMLEPAKLSPSFLGLQPQDPTPMTVLEQVYTLLM